MNDLNRDRAIIDLDELERQLREAGSARRAEARAEPAVPQDDPLAELARIVEQDDPYRQVWSRAARDGRVEPALDLEDEPFSPPGPEHRRPLHAAADEDPFAPADADPDQQWGELRPGAHPRPLLAEAARHESEYRQADSEPEYAAEGVLPPHPAAYDDGSERSGMGRRVVAIAAAVVVLAVGGAAAALMLRGHSPLTIASGEPPVIGAETGPSKIQPENPGGVEVPNQDRQIYERTSQQPAPVRVVGNTEQPVDVAQAPKAEPGQSIIPAPGAASTTPSSTATTPQTAGEPALHRGADNPVLAALAPRRVKTVSVRPDGTIIDGHVPSMSPASTQVASLSDAVPSGVPASTASTDPAPPLPESRSVTGATPAPLPKPRVQAAPTTTATPVKPAPAEPVATAAPAAAPPKPKPAARVASADPADVAPAPAAASGTFSVQLAAPASEQEARDTASRLAKRFSGELGGLKPAVRQAEVNGKTIWRVRVGAMARDEATALCVKIQGAGGQCFVAKN
jgi:hypothetical protein